MKRRARTIVGRWHTALTPRIVGLFADNMQWCSCVFCGNPRRFKGGYKPEKTRQELKSELELREQIEYLYTESCDTLTD